jgi:hypothetical protein
VADVRGRARSRWTMRPLYGRLDRMKLPAEEYEEIFDDVCVMADEAIAAMNEKDDD